MSLSPTAPPMQTPVVPSNQESTTGNVNAVLAPVQVLRIGKEVENIGERVAASKKRVSWRFVFSDSEQVHTITLEHSRISAKKRLCVDGKRLLSTETYCSGAWQHRFRLDSNYAKEFCVTIKDVKASVVDHHVLDASYELQVDDVAWDQLRKRDLPYEQQHSGLATSLPIVWSSAMYARRIDSSQLLRQEPKERVTSWTFVFGQHGNIHQLELHELDAQEAKDAEVSVLLDSRMLLQQPKAELALDDNVWKFSFVTSDHHRLELVVEFASQDNQSEHQEEKESYATRLELVVDGCEWHGISETDFVLKRGWYPVLSRSRKMNYYRNDDTKECLWEKPIVARHALQENHTCVPAGGKEPDNKAGALAAHLTGSVQPTSDDINLLVDFSEVAVHTSPKAKRANDQYSSFDPLAPARGNNAFCGINNNAPSTHHSPDKAASGNKASSLMPDFLS